MTTKVILDAEARKKLHDLARPLRLCDESGRILGSFIPSLDIAEYELCEPPISEEELSRREQSAERRYTTAEVLAHLERL